MTKLGGTVRVLEVPLSAESLNDGDVFILDNGLTVYQFNAENSSGMERMRGMQIVNEDIRAERDDEAEVVVLDGEEVFGCEPFWEVLGGKVDVLPGVDGAEGEGGEEETSDEPDFGAEKTLYKLSNESGDVELTKVEQGESLSEDTVDDEDIWVVKCDGQCFIHVGGRASREERMFVQSNCDALLMAVGLEAEAATTWVSKESDKAVWSKLFSS